MSGLRTIQRLEERDRPSDQSVVRIEGLHKSFGDNHVLIDFNLKVAQSENLVVLGRSGSGKSVLIKCIIGLLRPDEGMIEVLGRDVTELDHDEMDQLRVRIGFLFQSNALYDSMTVRENLEFPLRRRWFKLEQEEADAMVHEALDSVGLAHTVDMMPAELSGGMRKRIALARTLILKPEIILYDEPTTGLDPITSREIIDLMNEIHVKLGTASMIITHDLRCMELTADRVIVLVDGRCYAEGTYQDIYQSKDPKVKKFFE
jgi:phospholipid/cholesterol/gamma-HCH transport system ATP-binding protein